MRKFFGSLFASIVFGLGVVLSLFALIYATRLSSGGRCDGCDYNMVACGISGFGLLYWRFRRSD